MTKTAKKQRMRGRPFRPGQSGNPRGRPKGALGKRTLLKRQLEAAGPIDLLEAQTEISETLIRYFSELKVLSIKDVQLGARIVISISDQMCAIAKMVRCAESEKSRRVSKGANRTRRRSD